MMRKANAKTSAVFIAIFATFWSSIVGIFVGYISYNAYWQIRAVSFPTAHAVVTSSKIESSNSDDGTTYKAVIKFEYEVDGKTYKSDTYRFGAWGSSNRLISQSVKDQFPKGKKVLAYYDPNDYSRSVLVAGLQRSDYGLSIFLLPFVSVGLGLWFTTLKMLLSKAYTESGGIKVIEHRNEVIADFGRISGVYIALTLIGIGGLVGGIAFMTAIDTVTLLMLQGYWVLLLCGGLIGGIGKWLYNKAHPRHLIIDQYHSRMRFTFGQHTGWMNFDQIRNLSFETKKHKSSKRTTTTYHVNIQFTNDRDEIIEQKLAQVTDLSAAMDWNSYISKLTGFDPVAAQKET